MKTKTTKQHLMALALVLFLAAALHAQAIKTDTIIDAKYYKSYYSYTLKEPLYVTYHLYKGGGASSRKGMSFKKCGVRTASDEDYAGKSYDKGHLANAEDFASNAQKEEATFCYYNCVPQTVKLNRGIWKTWETKIRKLSQTTHLFIIAGSIYGTKTIGDDKIGVPDYCYKIVLDANTKKILYCLKFPNDDRPTVTDISLADLKKILGYNLVP